VGEKALLKRVISDEAFRLTNGYVYTELEVPHVVEKILASELNETEMEILQERVTDLVKAHCGVARQIRTQLEHYQSLNLDPAGPSKATSEGAWLTSLLRWWSSANLSLRGEPSLLSAGRDLVVVLVLAAVVGLLYTSSLEMSRVGKFFARNELFAKGIVVIVNFALLSFAILWFYRSGKRSKKPN
jgi:hypothetical protein